MTGHDPDLIARLTSAILGWTAPKAAAAVLDLLTAEGRLCEPGEIAAGLERNIQIMKQLLAEHWIEDLPAARREAFEEGCLFARDDLGAGRRYVPVAAAEAEALRRWPS